MKIVKMSLAAAVLVGASAFAVDNVKISGDAQVFYNTNDMTPSYTNTVGTGAGTGTSGNLFDKENSAADAALHLNVSADLAKNDLVSVSAGAGFTALSTLGLENNFVSNVWGGSHTASNLGTNGSNYPAKVDTNSWFNEAWIAISAGNTTAKVGRMELDTPLAFTETWSVEKNTFEAAVLINTDLPDTTLVGAYVGNGNGTETFGAAGNADSVSSLNLAVGAVVNSNGRFETYGENGAYAAGIINNSIKPLTVQAWYYDVSKLAQAYWLQADVSMEGILAGAQYSGINLEKGSSFAVANGITKDIDNDVYALMLGYEMKDMFTAKVSYSSVGKEELAGLAAGFNTATSSGASKLYTEAWWSYGYVVRADTKAYNVTVEVPVKDIADFGVYYTNTDSGKNGGATDRADMTEVTLTASRSFGPLDASLVYSNIKADDQNIKAGATKGTAYNQVQAYLTLNF
ncbi:hypothetical protein [Sulfurimonas sp. HSL3-2]|uniref:hypothetical protein n=1 Tax=Hydrocurvibacter mobilis TaxID=3131936 RepID=UPI0031F7537A